MKISTVWSIILRLIIVIISNQKPIYMYASQRVNGIGYINTSDTYFGTRAIPFQLNSKFVDIEIITQQQSSPAPKKISTESLSSQKSFINRHEAKAFKRLDIIKHGRSDVTFMHKIIIAVKQSNIDELEKFVLDISEPDSKNFGKFMTREEITALTSHTASAAYIVRFLKSFWKGKCFVIEKSSFEEYISGKFWL